MTNLNLIDAAWLPVIDRTGQRTFITPAQVVEDGGLRYRALASPRPDFDGALLQFLIGLLQTAFMPADEADWKRYWEIPPTTEELEAAFSKYVDDFNMGGDGPRFMQDLTLRVGEAKPISSLLLDAPSENALEKNKDHFVSVMRFPVSAQPVLLPPCSASRQMPQAVAKDTGSACAVVAH